MKNRIEKLQGIKEKKLSKAPDRKLANDQACADDDGFAIAKNVFEEQPADQDLDCWTDLWRRLKGNGSQFLK